MAGQRLAAKRDDARWVRERDRESERWAREDQTRFHERRREIYRQFMEKLSELRTAALRIDLTGQSPQFREKVERNVARLMPSDKWVDGLIGDASRLLPEMQLLCGYALIVTEAQSALDHMRDTILLRRDAMNDDVPWQMMATAIDEQVRHLREAYDTCLLLMRQDLGLRGNSDFPQA